MTHLTKPKLSAAAMAIGLGFGAAQAEELIRLSTSGPFSACLRRRSLSAQRRMSVTDL